MYENPGHRLLGFKDPSFPVPEVRPPWLLVSKSRCGRHDEPDPQWRRRTASAHLRDHGADDTHRHAALLLFLPPIKVNAL